MSRINPVSWKKFEKFVLYTGCKFIRQKGDHLIYDRSDLKRPVVFPKEKEIPVFDKGINCKFLAGVLYSSY